MYLREIAATVRAAQQRDISAPHVIEVVAETLGRAVSRLMLTLNPDRVILARPPTLPGDALLNSLQQRAKQIPAASSADVPEILNSAMGEYIGALGAAVAAVHVGKSAR